MPQKLEQIAAEFEEAPASFRLPMLLEYSKKVPPLPEYLEEHRDQMEQVHECQTPFFLAEEVDDEGRVHMFFDAPPEAPTTRSFAAPRGGRMAARRACSTRLYSVGITFTNCDTTISQLSRMRRANALPVCLR